MKEIEERITILRKNILVLQEELNNIKNEINEYFYEPIKINEDSQKLIDQLMIELEEFRNQTAEI
jgi:chromosome segregation ATPase